MEIKKSTLSDFDFIYSEIEKNFIVDERRDYTDALTLFKEGKYEIAEFLQDGRRVGFITLWKLSDFTFAEHFVIYEKYRNQGLGSIALSTLQENYEKILLEAEPPTTDIAKRILCFYKRNGFIANEQPYLQPAYRKSGSEVPLIIMSYPEALDNFDLYVSLIKREVYSKK